MLSEKLQDQTRTTSADDESRLTEIKNDAEELLSECEDQVKDRDDLGFKSLETLKEAVCGLCSVKSDKYELASHMLALEVKVAIHHPTAQLKPEMLARVKFLGRSQENSGSTAHRVLVPEKFLQQRSDNTAVVWVVTADRRASQRDITLGRHREAGWIETVSGLHPGDTLIADSEKPLTEGQRIRITGEVEP